MVNLTQCLHRHCKKQQMCLSPSYSYPREHSGNLASYLHGLLAKLMASLSISPASLPFVILITLIRIKILQQFPSSLGKDKSQTCGPQLPRNSLKLLKDFNKSQPKVWKNIGDKIWPRCVSEFEACWLSWCWINKSNWAGTTNHCVKQQQPLRDLQHQEQGDGHPGPGGQRSEANQGLSDAFYHSGH